MKDTFHSVEQIQGHFVFTCPMSMTWIISRECLLTKTAGRFNRKVDVGAMEHCTKFWPCSPKDRWLTTTDMAMRRSYCM